ncbi:MAG TPA: hypothetical protein DCY94_04500, partial [Firmicutes bacterium]|nr:hypothetical protein [Bacillota bacterium]
MKKNIIAILIFVVVIVASIASVMILKNDKTKYTMNYTAEDNKLYVIKLFENKITVSSNDRENCLNDICNENGYTFRVTFNEDNTDKVYEVFKELFTDDEKTKDIAFSAISSEQKKILNAVVVNDDSTLTTEKDETPVEKPENKKELIFTIKSDRIN